MKQWRIQGRLSRSHRILADRESQVKSPGHPSGLTGTSHFGPQPIIVQSSRLVYLEIQHMSSPFRLPSILQGLVHLQLYRIGPV